MTPLAKPGRPLAWDANGRPLVGSGALVDCPRRDANGSPDWETRRRVDIASWVKYDPGSREGAAPSDGGPGVGITFSLTGGWSTSDPTRAGVIYADPDPVRDVLGRPVRSEMGFAPLWDLNRITEPGSSSPNSKDILAGIVYWTGTADPTAASAMVGWGISWNSSNNNARVRHIRVATTATLSTQVGGTNSSGRAFFAFLRGYGSTPALYAIAGASGDGPSEFSNGVGSYLDLSSPSRLYRGFFMARTASADGTTRTFALDPYVSGSAQGIWR